MANANAAFRENIDVTALLGYNRPNVWPTRPASSSPLTDSGTTLGGKKKGERRSVIDVAQIYDKDGQRIKVWGNDPVPDTGTKGIPERGYVTEVEHIGTSVHRDHRRLECGASYAEINFAHSLGKGSGGLHIAQIFYKSYSWIELSFLKEEAHRQLGGEVIDLTMQESSRATLEEATDLLRSLINQLLLEQQATLAKASMDVAATLNKRVIKLSKGSRLGTRRKDLESLVHLVDDHSEEAKQTYARAYSSYEDRADSQHGAADLGALGFEETVEVILDTLIDALSGTHAQLTQEDTDRHVETFFPGGGVGFGGPAPYDPRVSHRD